MSVYFGGPGSGFGVNNDVLITETDPGVVLNATETGGVWCEVREIAGAFWETQNARWGGAGGTGWVQANPLVASYARQTDANGNTNYLSAAAGAPSPIVWTNYASISSTGTYTGTVSLGSVLQALAIESKADGTTLGYVPPVYPGGGAATGPTEHVVRGRVTIPVSNSANTASINVTLTGSEVFSDGTYSVQLCYLNAGSTIPTGWTNLLFPYCNSQAATTFTIAVNNANTSSSTGSLIVMYVLTGF